MSFLMVLNDGETFTTLEGCAIIQVHAHNPDDTPDLEEFVKETMQVGYAHEPHQLYSLNVVTRFQ